MAHRGLALVSLALVPLLASCRPAAAVSEPETTQSDTPPIDHGTPPAYAGTWVGPQLRLSFAGPWVLIGPREAGPGAQPIELRVTVERREGAAYALRTSLAEIYAADFVRPSDWTLLVEPDALALAMGDEPLEHYAAVDAPLLIGPSMLGEVRIPTTPTPERVLACVELASERCLALEADGPRALGCREALWAACVAHDERGEADPTARAAIATARTIHTHAIAVRYAAGLHAAAPAPTEAAAAAVHARAVAQARTALAQLRADGPLAPDPNLATLEAALAR